MSIEITISKIIRYFQLLFLLELPLFLFFMIAVVLSSDGFANVSGLYMDVYFGFPSLIVGVGKMVMQLVVVAFYVFEESDLSARMLFIYEVFYYLYMFSAIFIIGVL